MTQIPRIKQFLFIGVFLSQLLLGCASSTETPENDPWEPMNRKIFEFNQKLDNGLLRPIANGYRNVVPTFVQTSVSNVFDTIKQPMNFANAVLQLEAKDAGTILARTGVNLTFGFFGLFDVASSMGIPNPGNDFGQTLAKWGWHSGGPYLMIPALGPSNVRDAIGTGVDAWSPVSWFLRNEHELLLGGAVVAGIDMRASKIELLDNLKNSSTDYYAAMRTMYQQNRQKKIDKVVPKSADEQPAYEFDFEIEDEE